MGSTLLRYEPSDELDAPVDTRDGPQAVSTNAATPRATSALFVSLLPQYPYPPLEPPLALAPFMCITTTITTTTMMATVSTIAPIAHGRDIAVPPCASAFAGRKH
jgi:hypothetical protein